ncbi:MAG: S41 family peptidase [Candidatus Dormibacteria bacterium]
MVVIGTGVLVAIGLNRPTLQSVKEIASLAQILKTKDPVLHQPTQRTQFDHLAATLEAKARSDPSAPYWLVWEWLNKLTLDLKSPHAMVFFGSSTPSVYPLAFTWAANSLAVSSFPNGGASLPAYSQVLTLNGIAPGNLLTRMQSVSAGNTYFVRHQAGYLADPYMLHWIGVLGSSDVLRVVVREPDGATRTIAVRPVTKTGSGKPSARIVALSDWFKRQFPDFGRRQPSWYISTAHGYGVFRIYTMTVNQTLTTDLHNFFTAVEKDGLHRVLFDVRDNGGGSTCVTNAVLAYLPNPQGIMECSPPTVPVAGLVFHGSVFVAQDWGTFSAAMAFSAGLSRLPEVTVIGEPTGDGPSGDMGNVVEFKVADSAPALVGQVGTQQICFPWSFPGSQPSPIKGGCRLDITFNPKVFIPTTLTDLRDHIDPVIQWLNSQP